MPAPRPSDDVDALLAAWGRERPDLDTAPLAVMSRVARLARHLDRARGKAFARGDLAPWEFDVLAALSQTGPPYALTPKQLLHATLVTSGTMTARVDRLVERGLVVRSPDPRDGRGVLVCLTASGRDLVGTALAALLDWERTVLAPLSAGDQERLAGLLRALLVPFDAAAAVPAGDPPAG